MANLYDSPIGPYMNMDSGVNGKKTAKDAIAEPLPIGAAIGAAAGANPWAAMSSEQLLNYAVRSGQMSQEEADKLRNGG